MGLLSRLTGRLARRSALPMDEASRMARAMEMGFDIDTPLYHGTGADIAEFSLKRGGLNYGGRDAQLGVSLTSEPWNASDYALDQAGRLPGADAPNVMPVFARGRFLDVAERDLQRAAGEEMSVAEAMAQAAERARANGYDGLVIHGVARGMPTREYKIFPDAQGRLSNIRSRFARFDPAKGDSGDLTASLAIAAPVGGGLLSLARERNARS